MIIFQILALFFGAVETKTFEDDFRFISHNDLMAGGGERFTDDGVTSFGQLLFDLERDQLFVGARDNLYRLSLKGLKRLEKASWDAPKETITLCQDKGQSEDDCRNYVKVLLSDGRRLFACGTNAFSPQCSWREMDNMNNVLEWVKGVAKCPYNPKANITALMTITGHYYVGTPTDFSGSDPAIYRAIGSAAYGGHTLRTPQYNSKWLNEPQFVGSFDDDKFVYFVFREPAIEYMNCGKIIYSRIARVCKNDSGGNMLLKKNWTTFMKARLNCSLPGEYPFYYDMVQDIEYVQNQRLLFATFTTPRNSIPGSAICVFNMSTVENAFLGPFKHQAHSGSMWESQNVSHQQHTQCLDIDAKSKFTELFNYQLMDKTVQAINFQPVHTVQMEYYSHIAVADVETKKSNVFVIFVSNDDGIVKKLSVMPNMKTSCLIEILQPEMHNMISPLKIMKYLPELNSLYIGTENSVMRLPTSRCNRYFTKVNCLSAQDPLCGWDERREICSTIPIGSKVHWTQDQFRCPDIEIPHDGGWSAWSPWSSCLQKTEEIIDDQENQDKCLCQTRSCNNPTPKNGGKSCEGITIRVSNCTVHGGWTAWSGWSACSATCGVAVKWRRRACGAPAPKHGGRLCVGPDRSEIYCTQNPPCPTPVQPVREAGWSEWGSWSACSAPCGGGARWRQRRCDSPPPAIGAQPCSGCAVEAEACNKHACEIKRATAWTPWQSANPNNSSKGVYMEKRFKFSCRAQTTDQIKLSLMKEEERYCSGEGICNSSPLTDSSANGWSSWSQWDACSVECGGGYQTMTRTCLKPPCQGSTNIQRACNVHSCIDGWGCWGDWSPCSVSCGSGRIERRRPCLAPGGCKGDSIQTTLCDGPPCSSLLGWSNWSPWSMCDAENKQHRRRQCLMKNSIADSDICQGPDTETRLCNLDSYNSVQSPKQFNQPLITTTNDEGLSLATVIGLVIVSFLIGGILATGPILWIVRRRTPRIPSSPHYITKQNSYVSVPLKEAPKKTLSTFSKPNNINTDRDISLDSPKLYPKSLAGDYETATVKRNSHATQGNSSCKNNIDVDQDKFY